MKYFTKGEKLLWLVSTLSIIISFMIFDKENYLTLCASLIGCASLIFSAKGNPIGQLLMVLFSVLYGIISYSFSYYGEMITYLAMTMPMSVFALAYATNDIILIILWTLASIYDFSYISVLVCFAMFLINDLYGFINWLKMQKYQ